jgi:hypothetical protein
MGAARLFPREAFRLVCRANASFDDLWDQIQAILDSGRDLLIIVAAIWLGNRVLAQAQGDAGLKCVDWVVQWLYAGGIDSAHLFNEGKYAIELTQRLGFLSVVKFDLGQFDQIFNVSESKGHDGRRGGPRWQIMLNEQNAR